MGSLGRERLLSFGRPLPSRPDRFYWFFSLPSCFGDGEGCPQSLEKKAFSFSSVAVPGAAVLPLLFMRKKGKMR